MTDRDKEWESEQRRQMQGSRPHEVLKGRDAKAVRDEMRNGTPNTKKRVETIRRADEVFQHSTEQRIQALEAEVTKYKDAGKMWMDHAAKAEGWARLWKRAAKKWRRLAIMLGEDLAALAPPEGRE